MSIFGASANDIPWQKKARKSRFCQPSTFRNRLEDFINSREFGGNLRQLARYRENANRTLCTIHANKRASIVGFCPTFFLRAAWRRITLSEKKRFEEAPAMRLPRPLGRAIRDQP